MRKPVNKFAVVLWVLAVLLLARGASEFVMVMTNARQLAPRVDPLDLIAGNFWRLFYTTGLISALLASFAMIIQILGEISWTLRKQ